VEDARNIAARRCTISITDDLLKVLVDRTGGIIRLFVTELANAEALGQREGIEKVGVADMAA